MTLLNKVSVLIDVIWIVCWNLACDVIALQFRYTFYRLQTKRLRARKIG